MKTVCAWCRKVMIEDETRNAPLTHGVCPDCMKRMLENSEINLKQVLNSIDFPVLVTDASVTILQVNQKAEDLLGISVHQLEMPTVGIAIECRHAGAPEACGDSEQCAGCVLRQTIRDTSADGRPRYGVFSDHEVASKRGTRTKRLHFSTTRMGDAVVVAIEGIGDSAIKG